MLPSDIQKNYTNCSTVVDLLSYRSLNRPNNNAFTFLEDGEDRESKLSYQQLDRQARVIAAQLQVLQLTGERALLLYPPGLDYLAAFFGCLYAGVIAVPAYPPQNERNTPRIKAIAADAQAVIVLTTKAILSKMQSLLVKTTNLSNLQWLATDDLDSGVENNWQKPLLNKDSLAFLQYTSGSTGTPKGVMVSHGNLLHNAAMTYRMMEHSAQSKFISWLPVYHDMGLIGGILQPLYGGFPCILMSPTSFLQRPYRWLEAISRYKGTTSGAPNFAYELCIKKITPEQCSTLDLSSWDVAFNGAEPVPKSTLERFCAKFVRCGFRQEAFYPCYGMAEATLMVSGGTKTALSQSKTIEKSALAQNLIVEATGESQDKQTFVSCGQSIPEQKIVIVDPGTCTPCSGDRVGEIWVSGESVAKGYWNNSNKTKETFQAYLSDNNERPFLRTGDLGFLQNGELFITGRAKDLIIIRGRNLYPQDLELTAEKSHPALRLHNNAAFSVEVDDQERLAIVQELEFRAKPNLEEVTTAILQAVTETHEVEIYAVVLIKSGSIPKTSSGKIQRSATRRKFLEAELDVVNSSILNNVEFVGTEKRLKREKLLGISPRESQLLLESYLQEQVALVLKRLPGETNLQHPLSTLGLDSLKVFELKNRIEEDLEVVVSVVDFFEGLSIRSLSTKILAQLTTAESTSSVSLTKVETVKDSYPLSFAQARLWFLDRLKPGNPAYNISFGLRIQGDLQSEILEKSLDRIIQRHEILRTSFNSLEGQPIGVIAPDLKLSLTVVDCQQFPREKRESAAKRIATQEHQKPFNLTKVPLLRATLLCLAPEEYILLINIHHIIFDGLSADIFIGDLSTFYQEILRDRSSSVSELPVQYQDFIYWQKQWLHKENITKHLDYWKQKLANAPTILQLPTDKPRPPSQTYQGAVQSLILSKNLFQQLKTLARQENVTQFMLLLAAFKILLLRHTGQEDIVVGSPIANRNHKQLKGLVGFFVNTIVLRTNLAGNPSFRELLSQIRQVAIEAYSYQDLPFEQLVKALQPERNLSYTPIFQVMFAVRDTPQLPEIDGLNLTQYRIDNETAQFDLNVSIEEEKVYFEYNKDLFDAATISSMLDRFVNLLQGIVTNPEVKLLDLPYLTQTETKQLSDWNNTQIDYPQVCLPQLFEAQVAKTPDALAVVFGDEQLSYRELNARANQLAHYLQKLGVKPEVLVGICLERSLDMVIGLLAILKAGSAYIPLDPSYPQERLAFILEDTQAPVLLTQASLVEAMPQHKAQVICLDGHWQTIAQQSQENLFTELTTDNLAYTIYTSGSTGRPKGVMIKHASTVAMLDWANKTFAIEARAGVLASTSICFDLSVFEVFVPLCCGGKIILIENALLLPTLPASQSVTLINTVPSVISQLLRTDNILTSVQTVNIAGEPLHNQLVQQLYKEDNIQQVFNLYGPSEDTTYSTSAWIHKDASNIPPIGRPIHNTQTYLLDRNLQLVPVGVPGMLYIGGAGLSRGYLNKAELTADKFIPNPYANLPGERLYKTGDLARYLPNGEIEYIGRIDYQVKIRGFRIELGEIEALIIQHPAVREAVVAVHSSEVDSQRIVAYVVLNSEQTLTTTELHDFLEAKLPKYMVPAAFVILEALPLTPNGKIDRKALKAPDTARPEDKELVAPRNYVETKLTEIWADVLGVGQVGIFDNFFELGGDSILAIVVITKANKAGLQLTTKQLFQHQTVADLASVAVTKKVNQAEQGLITGLASLTPIQYWFFEQNLLEPHHWNQAVLLEVKQVLDLAVLEKTVQQLLLHHDALRLRFEQTKSGWQQVIASPDLEVPLIHLDFSALSESEQELAIEAAATKLQASLNLSTSPLMRVVLFDLGHQPSRLLILIHHLAVDGVSWRILLEDLETIYQQLSQGKKARLPAKTTSFKYWSQCLQEYAQSATRPQEWNYWLREEWHQVTPLPVDFSDGDNTVVSVRKISMALTVEQTQALLKEVPKAYNTQINDVLLTALVQAFSQWTGNNSLLLALEGHGREEIFDDVDLSRTVGWFTSVFPVLLDLGKTSHPVEALKLIKEQLRGIPNKGMGYGVLRYLSKDTARVESLQSLPQAEVIFNYLGQFDQTFSDSLIFKISQHSQGQTRSSWNRETYMLSIDALIIDNQLRVNWNYSKKIHRRSTIERLAQGFLAALQVLVTHCQSPEDRGYTPSDFPEADLSQQDLDRFLGKINRGSKNQTT